MFLYTTKLLFTISLQKKKKTHCNSASWSYFFSQTLEGINLKLSAYDIKRGNLINIFVHVDILLYIIMTLGGKNWLERKS